MKVTPAIYQTMTKRAEPKSRSAVNITMAFLIGGAICTVGELLRMSLLRMGLERDAASAWTSVLLVLCSMLLTGFGLYERLARHAGAGTLVPITGFANAVVSPAIEAKTEGYVLGIGTKIFTIAGPVILYGCTAAAIYGIFCYLLHL